MDVLPVPGGPYSNRWGSLFSATSRLTAEYAQNLSLQGGIAIKWGLVKLMELVALAAWSIDRNYIILGDRLAKDDFKCVFVLSFSCTIYRTRLQNPQVYAAQGVYRASCPRLYLSKISRHIRLISDSEVETTAIQQVAQKA